MTPLAPRFELPLSAIATRNSAGFIAAFAANPLRARVDFRPMDFPAATMRRTIVARLARSSR